MLVHPSPHPVLQELPSSHYLYALASQPLTGQHLHHSALAFGWRKASLQQEDSAHAKKDHISFS